VVKSYISDRIAGIFRQFRFPIAATVLIAALSQSAYGQVTQSANSLSLWSCTSVPSGEWQGAGTYIGADYTRIVKDDYSAGTPCARENNVRGSEFVIAAGSDDAEFFDEAFFAVDNIEADVEGLIGIWMGSVHANMVATGLFPKSADTESSSEVWTQFDGFLIRQSGTTWYGDLSMNSGTTFSADNLIASAITANSLQASTISSNSVSTNSLLAETIRSNSLTTRSLVVTGGVSIGGTLNMNGNPIINIANGVEATDAVNLSQLRQTQSQINAVQKESRVGVSGVAALVGLPDIPAGSDGVFGVGTGTHKGESTLAIGGARQINEKATIKFGLSTPSGNGGTVGSFGVGIKW
jgi:hypothetical protein